MKEGTELYLMTTGVTQEVQKNALLLHLAEENVMEIYKTHKENDAEQYNIRCEKLDYYFKPRKNIT